MSLTETILLIPAIILTIPALVVFIECMAALLPAPKRRPIVPVPRPRIAVLVPAHNEEAVIQSTLESILPELAPDDRLLVVADNCSDRTAQIAAKAGASVVERLDSARRGKGYALDHGLQHLAADPPDVVIVVDADCRISSGSIAALGTAAAASGRPVQGLDTLDPPTCPPAGQVISSLAFRVKNHARSAGLDRLRLPCLLLGTGMAFPWRVISGLTLASGNIVEDMQLALDLAVAGHPALLCESARVHGQLPSSLDSAARQRTRWEHGHMRTILTQTPRLLWEGFRQARPSLWALALDLAVPPLSLLVMVLAAATAVACGVGMLGDLWRPLQALSLAWFSLSAGVLAGWHKSARDVVPLSAMLAIPLYALRKVPLYLRFLHKPQREWLRTARI